MACLFVAGRASRLRRIGTSQRSSVCDSRGRAAGLCQQVIVTIDARFIPHRIQNFFASFFQIIFAAEVVLINILGAIVSFGRDVRKELIFWREMAINTLDTNAVLSRRVDGNLPSLISCLHLVALAAAIVRR